MYTRHDIWQLPRHVRTLDTHCMTSPVCPGEYSCGGQAINGISSNERRTKTRPETRFDCWTSNASGVVERDRGGLRRVHVHFNVLGGFPLYEYWHVKLYLIIINRILPFFVFHFVRHWQWDASEKKKNRKNYEERGQLSRVVRMYPEDSSIPLFTVLQCAWAVLLACHCIALRGRQIHASAHISRKRFSAFVRCRRACIH